MRRAFSLAETVIGLFLLTWATIILVTLLQLALRQAARGSADQLAVQIAEKTLEDLRAGEVRGDGPDPDDPRFRVEIAFAEEALYSPCTAFEVARADRVTMPVRRVTVTVTGGSQPFRLVSLLPEPRRAPEAVQVSAVGVLPDPLPRNSPASFQAQAVDAAGKPVQGVTFRWYISPLGSPVIVTQSRSGAAAVLTNRAEGSDGTPSWPGGRAILEVRAVHDGVELWGESAPVNLQ